LNTNNPEMIKIKIKNNIEIVIFFVYRIVYGKLITYDNFDY